MTKDYPLFIKWRGLVSYLLDLSGKYPKNVRFNLCDRITNLSLDAMELIVEAIYTKQRSVPLKKLNLTLEKIRVLMQISKEMKHISLKQYHYIVSEINECGKMVGGWNKSQLLDREGMP